MSETEVTRHMLSVLVQDIEGIISRVSGMFTRRAFSMISITSASIPSTGGSTH